MSAQPKDPNADIVRLIGVEQELAARDAAIAEYRKAPFPLSKYRRLEAELAARGDVDGLAALGSEWLLARNEGRAQDDLAPTDANFTARAGKDAARIQEPLLHLRDATLKAAGLLEAGNKAMNSLVTAGAVVSEAYGREFWGRLFTDSVPYELHGYTGVELATAATQEEKDWSSWMRFRFECLQDYWALSARCAAEGTEPPAWRPGFAWEPISDLEEWRAKRGGYESRSRAARRVLDEVLGAREQAARDAAHAEAKAKFDAEWGKGRSSLNSPRRVL